MEKKLSFAAKNAMVELSGACFWFWGSFHSFLKSCEVPANLITKYPRESYNKYDVMRNILDDLERVGEHRVINEIASGFYKLTSPVDKDKLDSARAKLLLREFKNLIGSDPIDAEIQKREQANRRDQVAKKTISVINHKEKLSNLNTEFMKLASLEDVTPQKRGFKLETLFFKLLASYEIEYTLPYRNKSEQIDGHFRYEKFDYLVETKWIKDPVKQPDLSIFDGKIRGKAQSTRGFFISASSFDKNAITKYSGDSPRILLMDGEDLALILAGQIDLLDGLKSKVDAIVRKGQIFKRLREI